MTDLIKENGGSGKTSSSRVIMLTSFGLIGLTWVVIMVGIFLDSWQWDRFEGPLDWAVQFVVASVIPYIGNKVSTAIGNNGKH